ncbi:MAG: hypothetical protein QF497_01720, partial [Verrucomicrobiota bacterium]|nr:hypothetical protein [Verrucomicrobiota bacterium]
ADDLLNRVLLRRHIALHQSDPNLTFNLVQFSGGTPERLPPAKFSIIAEHVWLLEKSGADRTFLV